MSKQKTQHQKRAAAIVAKMEPWWRDLETRTKPCRDGRTRNEVCFDSGVMAAAELVRRMTGDKELALAIHEAASFVRRGL